MPKYKSRGEMNFHEENEHLMKVVYSSVRQLYICDITDISTVPPERAACKKLTRTLENHSS